MFTSPYAPPGVHWGETHPHAVIGHYCFEWRDLVPSLRRIIHAVRDRCQSIDATTVRSCFAAIGLEARGATPRPGQWSVGAIVDEFLSLESHASARTPDVASVVSHAARMTEGGVALSLCVGRQHVREARDRCRGLVEDLTGYVARRDLDGRPGRAEGDWRGKAVRGSLRCWAVPLATDPAGVSIAHTLSSVARATGGPLEVVWTGARLGPATRGLGVLLARRKDSRPPSVAQLAQVWKMSAASRVAGPLSSGARSMDYVARASALNGAFGVRGYGVPSWMPSVREADEFFDRLGDSVAGG